MIPLTWHCEPRAWGDKIKRGFFLVATHADGRKVNRYYGHITIDSLTDKNLLLVMAHDVERLTADLLGGGR